MFAHTVQMCAEEATVFRKYQLQATGQQLQLISLFFLCIFGVNEKRQINTKIENVSMPISHLFQLRRVALLSTSELTNFTISSLFLGPIFSKWAALSKQRFSVFYKITMSHWLYTTIYSTQCSVHNRTRAGVEDFQKLNCISLAINRVWLPKLKLKLKQKTKAATKQQFAALRSNLYVIASWWPVCSLHCKFHFVSYCFIPCRFISFSFQFLLAECINN